MGLSRKDLGADEQVVVTVRTAPFRLIAPLMLVLLSIVAAIALIASVHLVAERVRQVAAALIVIVPLCWFSARLLDWRRRCVVLTSERLLVVAGVVGRRIDQVTLDRIIDVQIVRRARDRLVGRGDLILEVVDGSPVIVESVPNPQAFSRLVLRTRSAGWSDAEGGDASLADRPTVAPPMVRVVTEGDPTPPRGTPAVSGTMAAVQHGRLEELDALERSGRLSREEAEIRRVEILRSP